MKLETKDIKKSLAPSYRLLKPKRDNIESFKKRLGAYFSVIDSAESEENLKTHLMDLFKSLYHPNHLVEQQKRIDFVIRTGKKNTNAGVLFEAKRSSNSNEIITKKDINKKSFHELILYFMQERQSGNTDIKFLTICSEFEFFIFEAKEFERAFYKNTSFHKDFIDWQAGKKTDQTTDFFYNAIAKPFIEKSKTVLEATHFDIRAYKKELLDDNSENDKKIIPLFKVLSPEHLLKISFANDSNSLNKEFYDELLHIIGLEETKQSGKTVIQRLSEKNRNKASLIENTISKLTREDDFNDIELMHSYGTNKDERAFNISLELCITWVNRLLFLKLLESQIINYHDGDESYRFLNTGKISDYDELSDLFFGVLALKKEEREDHIKEKFSKVPYLNSSLFEKTNLEKIVGLNNLNYNFEIPLFKKTVLRNEQNKAKYKSLKTLDYIFEFLDAYDFASEGGEEIQEESKTLINAAVLGLIFEKINGYREGAVFTPGYITTYMSTQVIERAVIQKFSEAYPNWKLDNISDLKNYLSDHRSRDDIIKFNSIINSIKICDPAVGSGHFLVSCLNELIAIKSRLGLLADENGNRLSEYDVEIDNDEIIITHASNAELFKYKISNNAIPETLQKMQKGLFHEKQTLIENCLFGVDINASSVKICQLRLWIELLKNAYYTVDSGYEQLETLPNIDINIKQGNSLLSRYTLDQNLSNVFGKNLKVGDYKSLVHDYKNTKDRQKKRELMNKIDAIKARFKNEIQSELEKDINKKLEQLNMLKSQGDLFGDDKDAVKSSKSKIKSQESEIKKLQQRKEEFEKNNAFISALEWRFEFPEVLDDKGKFVGFDIIIANPPYMRIQEIEATQPIQKTIYENQYDTARGSYDLANLFFELAGRLANEKSHNIFIFPHKLFNSQNGGSLREYLMNSRTMKQITHFGANMVFDNAITYTCIALFDKREASEVAFKRFRYGSNFQNDLQNTHYQNLAYEQIQTASELYGSNQWVFFDTPEEYKIFEKIYSDHNLVSDIFEIYVGLQTSRDTLYVAQKISENDNAYTIKVNPSGKEEKIQIQTKTYEVEKEFFKPFLMGKDVHRYDHLETDRLVFFPYKLDGKAELVSIDELESKYPLTFKFVTDHKAAFSGRENGKAKKLKQWYAYIYPKNLDKFDQEKLSSMEICSTGPNVTVNDKIYHSTTVYSWVKNDSRPYTFYAAIFNSKLFWWFLKNTGDTLQGDARRMKTNYLNPFPLPANIDKEQEKHIEGLVKEIMQIKKEGGNTSKIPSLEDKINKAVYDLYSLSGDEVSVVENSAL